MKKLLIYLLLLPIFAKATNYYVSNSGNDSNNGTSTSTPWLTIAKVNGFTFSKGDSLFFNKGNNWVEQLAISQKKIYVGSYGSGAKPIITGFTTISSWTSLGGNLYQSNVLAVGSSNKVNILTINGVQYGIGRYPHTGYLASTAVGSGFITGTLTGTPDFTGGTLVYRTTNWKLEKNTITSQSGGTLNYSGSFTSPPIVGWGYFIQNNINCLTNQGDWYYDPSAQKITIYSTSAPSGFTIQYASTDVGIHCTADSVTINGLTFSGINTNAINNDSHSYLTVNNTTMNFIGVDAVISGGNHNIFYRDTINNSLSRGINLFGTNVGTWVIYCTLNNIAEIAGMASSGNSGYGIIFNSGTNVICQNNTITNVGYVPIFIIGTNYNCNYNYIDTFCNVTDDGGGVYTNQPSSGIIKGNLILNGIGAGVGNLSGYLPAEGLYNDGNASGVEFANNTVAHMAHQGLHMNGGSNINIHDNSFYDCANGVGGNADNFFNITFLNNYVYALAGQFVVDLTYSSTTTNTVNNIGNWNSNTYSRPSNENNIFNVVFKTGGLGTLQYNLSGWKTAYSNLDQNSTGTPVSYTGGTTYFLYHSPVTNQTQMATGTFQTPNGSYLFNNGQTMQFPLYGGGILLPVGSGSVKVIN